MQTIVIIIVIINILSFINKLFLPNNMNSMSFNLLTSITEVNQYFN